MQKLHTYHLFVIVDVQKLIVGTPPLPLKKPRYIFKTVIFLNCMLYNLTEKIVSIPA